MGSGTSSGIRKIIDWLENESKDAAPSTPIGAVMFAGKTLEQIEERSRKLEKEEIVFLDENGKPVAAFRGDESSVGFPARLLERENLTVTHNHPKGIGEFGGTFSFADINNMLDSKWAEHRATASGQGEMNYIIRRKKNADAKGLRNRINKDHEEISRSWKKTYTETFTEQIKKGKKPAAARHIARQKGVGEINAYYKKVLPEYGYEYITRKNPYKYNR